MGVDFSLLWQKLHKNYYKKTFWENWGYLTCDSWVIIRWFQEIIFVGFGFGIGLNKNLFLLFKKHVLVQAWNDMTGVCCKILHRKKVVDKGNVEEPLVVESWWDMLRSITVKSQLLWILEILQYKIYKRRYLLLNYLHFFPHL